MSDALIHRSEPVRAGERVAAIDVIRGFALLGVLLMNIQYWFRCPLGAYLLNPHPWPGVANTVTDTLLSVFMQGKSVSLFSFLFGVGLLIQMERAENRVPDLVQRGPLRPKSGADMMGNRRESSENLGRHP